MIFFKQAEEHSPTNESNSIFDSLGSLNLSPLKALVANRNNLSPLSMNEYANKGGVSSKFCFLRV